MYTGCLQLDVPFTCYNKKDTLLHVEQRNKVLWLSKGDVIQGVL